MIENKLFWIKYRPNTLEKEKGKIPIILLPRIKNIFKNNNIPFNVLFKGTGGTGKTSLAEILIQDTDYIRIDCSKDTGVDVVRNQLSEHCQNYSIPLKRIKNKNRNLRGQKVILLEEFDKTTPNMRGALRGFIEDYSDVRFIANVNKFNAISRDEDDKALLSRFNIINFDPETKEEVEYLKINYIKYIKAIAKNNKFDIPDEAIKSLINKNFPNLRNSVQILQEIIITGDYNKYLKQKNTVNTDIYTFMLNKENNIIENFYFVSDNYPKDETETLLNILSYNFVKYLIENYENIMIKNGLKIIDIITKFNATYTTTLDPETHLVTFIGKLKELL